MIGAVDALTGVRRECSGRWSPWRVRWSIHWWRTELSVLICLRYSIGRGLQRNSVRPWATPVEWAIPECL